MKVVRLQLALQTAILAVVYSWVGRADDANAPELSKGKLQAKIQYCYDCHGSLGQGYRGFYPMPRLAGQTPEYLENQLRAFVERRRERAMVMTMSKVHGGLSPEMQTALATHFRGLDPPPIGGAPRSLADTGKKIYEEGVPEANVPACSACHGPEARGNGVNARLAGQLYPYTVKELTNWSKERLTDPAHPDTAAIMEPIAHSLTRSQIEAVAAYVAYLK